MQYSTTLRNAQLDALETHIGTAPILRVYAGSVPANVAASLGAATLLAEGTLPSDWLAAASSGSKAKNGTWTLTGQSGAGAGTDATFFRIYASDGTTPHIQGTAGEDDEELLFDNSNIADGQTVNVTAFSFSAGNA